MRIIRLLVLFACASSIYPQTCGPSPSVLRTLDELATPDDMRLPAAERQSSKIEILRKALHNAPNDVFLHEKYQRIRMGEVEADRPRVIAQYEGLLAQHPDDPVYLYLAALAQAGRNTPQAIARLDRAIERSPSFALPHLLLARIYSAPSHADPAKVRQHVERFESACPDSVRTFDTLRWSKDMTLLAQVAGRIRRNLKGRTDSEALAAYSTLWDLEAAQHRSDEQTENIARIKQDAARLLAPEVPRNAAWLTTLQSTAYRVGADDYSIEAQRQIAARFPNSRAAITVAYLKARDPNPDPTNGTPEQLAAYWHKEWQAALPLARKFPGSLPIAGNAALSIARDPSATQSEIHDAVALLLAATKTDPDGSGHYLPEPIGMAQTLVERGILDDVPALVLDGLAEVERSFSPDNANDVFGSAVGTFGSSAAPLRTERDQMNLFGYGALSEAYIHLGRLSSAKDSLLEQDEILNRLRPTDATPSADKFEFAEHEALCWNLKGLFAEAEHRKLDALIDYRNALSAFPPRRRDRRDQVMQSAERLWKELGGTGQGWNDWGAHSSLASFDAGSGPANAWKKLPPGLTFTDVLGREYKAEDLATKTTLVTMWASWCGSCRAELPYFEKLYRQFQSRGGDIVLLAFDIDDDIADMNTALGELRLSIPSVYATPFVYSMLPKMAIPANWLLTSSKTELLHIDPPTLQEWQTRMVQAIENAAAR